MPKINVGNLIVDYHEAGIGMPVVFIPGITEFKEAFHFQFLGLQDTYRVISYDLRQGLKKSSEYTLDLLVEDLRRLLETLDITSAVICGYSFGALIAMQFALQYPSMTNALVLVSGFAAAPADSPERFLAGISVTGHPFHRSLGTRFKLHMARLIGGKTQRALTMEYEASAVRMLARQAEKTSRTTVNQRMRIIQKSDFRSALSDILRPTLVIVGAKDRAFFLASAQELYENIPDTALEVIEGGGHLCFLTRHDLFNAALDDFLSERLAEIS
ncbi:MAG: alpha/beta fold hydrolase [Armatimonadota bacterium]